MVLLAGLRTAIEYHTAWLEFKMSTVDPVNDGSNCANLPLMNTVMEV